MRVHVQPAKQGRGDKGDIQVGGAVDKLVEFGRGFALEVCNVRFKQVLLVVLAERPDRGPPSIIPQIPAPRGSTAAWQLRAYVTTVDTQRHQFEQHVQKQIDIRMSRTHQGSATYLS